MGGETVEDENMWDTNEGEKFTPNFWLNPSQEREYVHYERGGEIHTKTFGLHLHKNDSDYDLLTV